MKIERNGVMESNINRMELSVNHSGNADLGTRWCQENVCSPYSRLYFVYEGSGELRQNGEVIPLKSGNVYLVPTGMRFSYSCKDHLKKIYFHINILKPDGYDAFFLLNRIGRASVSPEKMQLLRKSYKRQDLSGIWMVKSILCETVTQMFEQFPACNRPINLYSPVIQETMEYIREHLSIQISIGELAERQFVSKSFLSRRFREEVGVSISQYIDDQIFFAAQWQLLRTDQSIAAISDQFGFCDQFYFSRRFKQKYAETPNRYRRIIRQEREKSGKSDLEE